MGEPEYAGKVRVFANPMDKTAITTSASDSGKGWSRVRVGNKEIQTRKGVGEARAELLQKYYPNYTKELSTFTPLGYHSGLSHRGKIHNYGTHKYTLEYSKYAKVGEVKLLQPVKTERKERFAKVTNRMPIYAERYVVLNWRPEGNTTKLWVEVIEENGLTGEKKKIVKTKEFDVKDSNRAISAFRQEVDRAKLKKVI